MAKDRQTVGTDGLPLPILPPERDARVWARLVRIMFYTPGFMGLLLIKTGEPASFGITGSTFRWVIKSLVFIGLLFDQFKLLVLITLHHLNKVNTGLIIATDSQNLAGR